MAVFNFNDSTPAAPSGKANIKWQADNANPRNVSAYVPAATISAAGAIQLEPSADVTKFLRGDGFWSTIAFGGVNSQTGTSYTVQASDAGLLVSFNNASSVAVTIPTANTMTNGFVVFLENRGAGTVTVTPASGTIDGTANVPLYTNQGAIFTTDATNWFTMRGKGPILQTNGVTNSSQSTLNLVAGSNVTLTDGGSGQITIASSGGSGGSATERQYYPASPTTALATAILTDAPMAFWKCDDAIGATTLADSSGNSRPLTTAALLNDATIGAGNGVVALHSKIIPTVSSALIKNMAAAAGVSRADYCGLGAGPLNIDISFECVVLFEYAATDATNITLINMQGPNDEVESSNIQFMVDIAGGRFRAFWEYGAGLNPIFDSYIPFKIAGIGWAGPKHICVTKATATKTVSLYINGVLMDSETYLTEPTGGTNSPHTYLGCSISNAGQGQIMGYAAVYNKVLTAARVLAHAQAAGLA